MSVTVLFDGACGFCRKLQRAVSRLDWFGSLTWVPFQSEQAAAFGIPSHELEQRMFVIAGTRRWAGFAAWKQVLQRLPVLYIVVLASVLLTPWSAIAWVILWSPLAAPLGERVYDRVARNRDRLPGSSCPPGRLR